MAFGRNMIAGLNVVGLKRAGITREARKELREAFRIMYRQGNSVSRAREMLREKGFGSEVRELIDFMGSTKRGIAWKSQNELTD
ncbi:MAG: acyl-ACP--UDP-N-acetylglucosamine O-acyltransferase, partial [Candidatus Sumerlaeota bacterium]